MRRLRQSKSSTKEAIQAPTRALNKNLNLFKTKSQTILAKFMVLATTEKAMASLALIVSKRLILTLIQELILTIITTMTLILTSQT